MTIHPLVILVYGVIFIPCYMVTLGDTLVLVKNRFTSGELYVRVLSDESGRAKYGRRTGASIQVSSEIVCHSIILGKMIYVGKISELDAFTNMVYNHVIHDSPVDYLEYWDKMWEDDLNFIFQQIPNELFDTHQLMFHYTNQ